ncbi:MAG: hypothetical protein K9K38_00095 [Rhodoferax sp.]|nr:hypothetical protein [Rhodoferax sp.]MCF8207801.1 hypothetical protein [Rhodoferax sp.]
MMRISIKWSLNALVACIVLLPLLATAQSAIDGRWRSKDSDEIVSFRTESGSVTMAASSGVGYTAKLDGSDAPVKGDKDVDTVSVVMLDNGTLVETNKKSGKEWLTMRMQVDSSGRTAKVTWNNLKTGKSGIYEMLKQ